jgi:NAD(P)-dependent dehydrogenase (short-subunit alcohol dehydrogenase family)
MTMPLPLEGRVALVAGATRAAGRGIARELAAAGAKVYCTGRSVRGAPATPGRPETIDETAELIAADSGQAVAVRVDHTVDAEVEALAARIKADDGRLDILVNDIWGGDELIDWGAAVLEAGHGDRPRPGRSGALQPLDHRPALRADDGRGGPRPDRRGHGRQ